MLFDREDTASPRQSVIYLDNAATSWPKPPAVGEAMLHFLDQVGANPGRAGHRLAVEAARTVYAAREAVAEWPASKPGRTYVLEQLDGALAVSGVKGVA